MWNLHCVCYVLIGQSDLNKTALVGHDRGSSIVEEIRLVSQRNEMNRATLIHVGSVCDSHVDLAWLIEVDSQGQANLLIDPGTESDAADGQKRLSSKVELDVESHGGWEASGQGREEERRDTEVLDIDSQSML